MNRSVNIAEMVLSTSPKDTLVTHALGSCIGITLFDPEAAVGALVHIMLPSSTTNPERALRKPFMFADTGIPRVFKECYAAGAEKSRLIVKVAGGASTSKGDQFEIGRRNIAMLRKLFWKNSVLISGSALGGTTSRSMSLDMSGGVVKVRSGGVEKLL